jgi:ATP-dependent DNA ligase
MLAKAVKCMPTPDSVPAGLLYEPKWDGFRCIVFRDGDEVELGSRNERPLTRYFPDVVEAVKAQLPERCVVDGEIVIATPTGLDFDALQLRLHPAESRVRKLAAETPASFVAFDLLAVGDESLMAEPLSVRRSRLEQALAHAKAPVHLTPATTDVAVAEQWFTEFEGARVPLAQERANRGLTGARPLRRWRRPAPRGRGGVVHHEAPSRAGRRAGPVPRERHGGRTVAGRHSLIGCQ